jgi:predicted transcriptional regulator
MVSLTIRVNRSTHDLLRKLAERESKPMSQIVEEAVRDLEERRFWAEYHAAYAALAAAPDAWADFHNERSAWDGTLTDGLEDALHRSSPAQ